MDHLRVSDLNIQTFLGRVFTRSWVPGDVKATLPPILLFHDSLGCVELWRSFPAHLALATARRVIAYDRPGFGRSQERKGRLANDFISEEAKWIIPALCQQAGFDMFIACGHSIGGGMAVETAARLPDQCVGVITIAAQAFVEEKTREGIRQAAVHFQDPKNFARLEKYHGKKAQWVADAWIKTWLSPDFGSWTLDRALAGVTCPLLAIHGEQDEYGSKAHPQRISENRGDMVILPGIGHLPHREAEEKLIDIIAGFLR